MMARPRTTAELIDGMYVVGDIAYTPKEWEQRERDVARKRNQRAKGCVPYQIVASLHDLRCAGPTRETGCRCKKRTVLRRLEAA